MDEVAHRAAHEDVDLFPKRAEEYFIRLHSQPVEICKTTYIYSRLYDMPSDECHNLRRLESGADEKDRVPVDLVPLMRETSELCLPGQSGGQGLRCDCRSGYRRAHPPSKVRPTPR